ncbi:hypothetical protein [Quadrisphaera sp. KR29]|uniref:hypothetical protein n=1 Tax=Quadrisphaera sp. KR29 TaxID=3461391 RepID=UPI0040449349
MTAPCEDEALERDRSRGREEAAVLWTTREQVLAARRSTPWYQLEALARSRDAVTRLRVARNPSAQGDALVLLARDADPEVREQVARRTDPSAAVLTRLGADASAAVRAAVARNPATPGEVLRALAEDPHHGVRFAVQASQRQRLRAAGEQAGAPRGADPDALAATA